MNQWNNLTRLLRGSSDEADLARRSTQSTPRMSRARVRDASQDVLPTHSSSSHHHQAQAQQPHRGFGSLGSMEVHRVNRVRERSWESDRINRVHLGDQNQAVTTAAALNQAALNRSWDIDKVPALDRNWEMERARGMEMVYRSMEKEKERRLHQAQTQAQTQAAHGQHRQKEGKKKKRKRDKSKESQAMMEQIDNNKLSQERLERRIDELNRMLLEEKHSNRKDKLAVAKLQQEVARQKSDRSIRETLMKELDRERMLRLDAERRLRESAIESENYKARLLQLQDEFKKMEEMARTLLQYKNKVDQLKQEKATLSISYEKNMQKFRTEISNLEHENKIVSAELKRLETECDNCQQCNKDLSYRVTKSEPGQSESSEKVKMLLERLKHLEEEKSQLVLENENQRQQYEKCLDEIANQVVQALLSQKGLREECGKLQKRVMDLEEQNRQLKDMFHQRIKFASDSFLQAMSSKSKLEGGGVGVHSDQSLEQTKYLMLQGLTGSCDSITPLSQISLGSLQSICSNYQESSHTEENDPGKPKPSSPPSWLRDQIQKTDSPSSSVCSPATVETMLSTLPHKQHQAPPATAAPHDTTATSRIEGPKGSLSEGSMFQGHLVIAHSGSQSAFYPVTTTTANGTVPAQNGEVGGLTNQIPRSDQAHLHMLHMQNIALQQQRMHSVGNVGALDSSGRPSQPGVTNSSTGDLQNDMLFPVTDIDTKLISSIQNAKKRFSQGRLQGVNIDGGTMGGRTGSASHTETEFPADNTSPKMKHNSPFNSPTNSCSEPELTRSRQISSVHGGEEGYRLRKSPGQSSSSLVQSCSGHLPNSQSERRNEGQAEALLLPSNLPSRPKPVKLYLNGRPGTTTSKSSLEQERKSIKSEVSPGKELLKMTDAFNDKLLLEDKEGMAAKIGQFLDSDSDDSDASRPLSKALSMASTMSLNELLEKGLENISTPMDENFSLDNFQIFDSDEEGDFKDPIERMKWTLSKGKEGTSSSNVNKRSTDGDPMSRSQTVTDKKGNRFLVNVKKNEESEKDYGDYVCLKKIKEYVFMNMPDVLEKEQREKNSSQTSSLSATSPIECVSPAKCVVKGSGSADCKSSQTSPEEVCQCGSCDDVFLSCDRLNCDPEPQKSSRSVGKSGGGRPSDLGLQNGSSSESYGKVFKTGSLKKTNKVSPGNNMTCSSNTALNSSYHDYVNLTPEMVQEILSRESTPNRECKHLRKSSENKDLNTHSRTSLGSSNSVSGKGCSGGSGIISPAAVPNGASGKIGHKNGTSKDRVELSCNNSGSAESQNTSKLSEPKLSEAETASSSSPDSAMQRSYASTTSSMSDKGEHLSLERLKYGKDEGYSSNSANSIKTESVLDMAHASKENMILKDVNAETNTNCNNNSTKSITKKKNGNKGAVSWNPGDNKVHLEAEVHAHYEKMGGSLTSLHSVSSVERECHSGKIRDIKEYVEGKMEEVRRSLESLDRSSPLLNPKKGLRHVPKTSPYHHRPHSCSPHRGAGLINSTAANQMQPNKQVPSVTQPVSCSLIPKPCLIKHVLRRSHSMSCVIQMARLHRIPQQQQYRKKTPSYESLKRVSKSSLPKDGNHGTQNGLTENYRMTGSQDYHMTGSGVTTGYAATAMGHVIKPPSYKSAQMSPNKLKMGISYRRKSETQEDRRIVGEGSETGYRSREELRPEGVVIRKYEEEEGHVGPTLVQNPALAQFSYKLKPDSSPQHNKRTNCKPVSINLNRLEPDELPEYSGSNQSYTSLSGDSSSLEESIQLLNGIGLPEGLDDLERQYNIMQENLKVKLNNSRKASSENPSWFASKFSSNKSKSLDCIGYMSNHSSNNSKRTDHNKDGLSKSSLGLHITESHTSGLNDITRQTQAESSFWQEDDQRVSQDDISQDDISLQIESLSRTVDDIQKSLSSLSVDTLVDENQVLLEHSSDELRLLSHDGIYKSEEDLTLSEDIVCSRKDVGDKSKGTMVSGKEDALLDEEEMGQVEGEGDDIAENLSKWRKSCEENGGERKQTEEKSRVCPQGNSIRLKKDSSFLANLILLGVSDDEADEDDFTSGDSDVFWDSPVQSWHMNVSGDNMVQSENSVPLSLLNDLSPSPTCPRPSGEFPKFGEIAQQFESGLPSIGQQQDSLSAFHKNMESGFLNCEELGCSETTDFYEPFCRTSEATSNPDIKDDKQVPFHIDKFIDTTPCVKESSHKYDISTSCSSEEGLSRRFSLVESPVNQRVAKLKEESRLENDTSIHRLSDAEVQSTSHLYKTVLSNTSSNSTSELSLSNASLKSQNAAKSSLSVGSQAQTVSSKLEYMFYKHMNQSFESPDSSLGVDGLSLSDSCCGSLSGQESE